jgi:hypothetical protein
MRMLTFYIHSWEAADLDVRMDGVILLRSYQTSLIIMDRRYPRVACWRLNLPTSNRGTCKRKIKRVVAEKVSPSMALTVHAKMRLSMIMPGRQIGLPAFSVNFVPDQFPTEDSWDTRHGQHD